MPQLTPKHFNDLDLTSLEFLDKKLYLLLGKYILQNKDFCVYAIIDKNILKSPNFNIRDLEQFILQNYPKILVINSYLDDELNSSHELKYITEDKIYLSSSYGREYYTREELSNFIFNHNKNLVIPSSNQYLLEKEKLIEWHSYNTPIMSDPTITPMTGTGLGQNLRIAKVKYMEWIIASSYLLKEFNIWMKAKNYLENKNSEFELSSIEFKQAYYYIILRQFEINITIDSFDQKDVYIRDFYVYDIIYRELCEDILYILLNLLLADKIIGNEALVNSLDNDHKFFEILTGIIKNHYDQNKEGYETLKNLRLFTCNNYLTTQQIKNIIKKL